MRRLLILTALALLAPARARAFETFTAAISSAVYSGVAVSTGTSIRVDNINKGAAYTLSGRNAIVLSLAAGASCVYCGYDSSVSTTAVTSTQAATFGQPYCTPAGQSGQWSVPISTLLKYFCQAADAAGATGQALSITQVQPR